MMRADDSHEIQENCVHKLIEAQVRKRPDAIAVVFEEACLTYASLNQKSDELARELQLLGVRPEVRVAVLLERSLELVISILAVEKAGGAYVPIDMSYPPARVEYMLQDSQAQVILTQASLCQNLPPTQVPILLADQFVAKGGLSNALPVLQEEVLAENIAYVVYTSGSTGRPKGVAVSHQSICNTLQIFTSFVDIVPDVRFLQFAALGFDAAVLEIFSILIAGASLILASREHLYPGPPLLQTLLQSAITGILLPPSALAVLPYATLPDLHFISCGGEAFAAPLVAQWAPGRAFYNVYGPTEAAVCATLARCTGDEGLPPLGRPLANTQAYILDKDLQPTPPGVVGELYLGGRGLARGYLGKPDLTADVFIPDPFSQIEGARLYRTGDRVFERGDGNLEFVGRVDQQVKIRGFRVELGEIESTLLSHPSIREAVVLIRDDIPTVKRLVAYVTTFQNVELSEHEISSFLKTRLPGYMLPSTIILLDTLPLTPNNKLDRQALPAIPSRKTSAAPRNQTEVLLTQIWAELFQEPFVGIFDNFFDLGGHSLLLTRLLARIQQSFGITVSFQKLFQAQTIAEQAEEIERSLASGKDQAALVLRPVPRNTPLPLSFPQEQIWFLLQLMPDILSYNFQATLEFVGNLNIAVLAESLQLIVDRHEIFRTTFESLADSPVQIIHDRFRVLLPVIDLCDLPASERPAEAARLLQSAIQQPFRVAQLPLIRWTLLRLDRDRHVLIHVEHHFVHDGWSFNVFVRELVELYGALGEGKPSPLPALPIQFADFAYWQRQWLQGDILASQLAYWKKKLADSPSFLELPLDYPRPEVQRFQGAVCRENLSPALYTSLKGVCRQEGVTLFMTMFAAFLVLLFRYTGQEDLCVGSAIANRRWPETEGLIGMFVHTLVLRSDLAGNPTFQELLGRVREGTLEAYAHPDLPFDKLVEALQPQRNLSYNPLFQVMFGFHDSPLSTFELPEMTLNLTEGISNHSAKFDLNVILLPRSEQRLGAGQRIDAEEMTLIWEYNTDLFAESTIRRMVEHYRVVLESIATNLHQHIGDLPLLTESERRQLLHTWNETRTDYPRNRCVHELFEAQVERTPDAVAVVFEHEQLTYQELNRQANRLACYLRGMGVGPERLVGICMERSLSLVVGLLGILKAGGAYVPLDVTYPAERLAFMLTDARVSVVLTQQQYVQYLPECPVPVVCSDAEWEAIAQEPATNLAHTTRPDNLAYVVYTSGSTGNPKGVSIPHLAINRLVSNTNYVQLQPSDRVALVSNVSFDAATFEIWGALLQGAQLISIAREAALSPHEFATCIQEQGVTALFLTTALLNQVAGTCPSAFNSVKHLLFGGEAVEPRWIREILEYGPPQRLLHVYGPTENTTFSTWYLIEQVAERATTIPIGRPLANTHLYILDRYLRPVPVGVPGELYIGGDGLARNYLNQPELTAENFIPDPFSHEPGSLLYRTGDLVRYNAGGYLEFLGRRDTQVKIRGFRIELGEIETVLARHPAVQQAVLMVREDMPGNKQLVAYLVMQREGMPTSAELRSYLKRHVPDYMIPSAFVLLEELPLTPNGKIDRRVLPPPGTAEDVENLVHAIPRNPVEETIMSIWCEVLGAKQIGIYDNFFEIGGHSLLATQIISRIRSVLHVDLPLRQLFEQPTIAGLALASIQGQSSHSEIIPRNDNHIEREQLLARLEYLSEEEADALLDTILKENMG